MAGVAAGAQVARPAEAVVTLHDPEAALNAGADAGDRLVEPALPGLQRSSVKNPPEGGFRRFERLGGRRQLGVRKAG